MTMTVQFSRFWRAFAAATLAAVIAAGAVATSADAQRSRNDDENASAGDAENRTFSRRIGEMVLEVQELLDAEPQQFSAALGILNEAAGFDDITPYELAVILQLRGNVNYELDQPRSTINDWSAARNTGALTEQEDMNLQFNIGQIELQNENYAVAARELEDWLSRGGEPSPQIHLNLVAAYSELNQLSRALPHGRSAFALASPPERRHYDVLNYLYTELNMPRERAELLQEMVQLFPQDRSIWLSIAALYAEAGREDRAFEINKIMYLNGMFDEEREIMRIVDYYSYYGVPYRAARILEREMNAGRVERSQRNYEKLARLYRQAREFDLAIAPLTEAARRSGDGELYQQLGEAFYAEGRLEESENALTQALNASGLDRPGNAWVVIGNTRYERAGDDTAIEDREHALEAFREATNFSHSRRTAEGWIQFIEAEIASIRARVEFERETYREGIRVTCRRLMRDEVVLETLVMERGEDAYFILDPAAGNGSAGEAASDEGEGSEGEAAPEGEVVAENEGRIDCREVEAGRYFAAIDAAEAAAAQAAAAEEEGGDQADAADDAAGGDEASATDDAAEADAESADAG